jgi:hypothetical protein
MNDIRNQVIAGNIRLCWNPKCNYSIAKGASICTKCCWTKNGPPRSSLDAPTGKAFLGDVKIRKAVGKTEPRLPEMNKTEQRYAAHLAKKKLAGEILWYRNHAFVLYFEDGTRYTADFSVMDTRGGITLIDTKAFFKNKGKPEIKEASMLKLKRAAQEFWMFTIVATWEVDGAWQERMF